MEPYNEGGNTMTTKKSLLVLGLVIAAIIGSLLAPASWFGVSNVVYREKGLILTPIDGQSLAVKSDEWKGLIENSLPSTEIKTLEGQKPDPEAIKKLNDPNNLTASFSKNLYVATTKLAKTEGSTKEQQQEILNQLIKNEADKVTIKAYTLSDITIAKSENKDSIRKYGNDFALITKTMVTRQIISDNFGAVEIYLTSKNPKDLEPLSKNYKALDIIIDKLLALPVPPSAAIYHVQVLNQISGYRDMLFNLSRFDSDPIRATLFIDKYTDTVVATIKLYQKLADYFSLQNIVFTNKDAGYLFTIGYTLK